MKSIKQLYPIIECCEMSIFLERRISKHGDKELVVFRVELENGLYYCFSSFDCVVDFIKTNFCGK